ALGVGIGAGATFGAMLHAVNHSIVKAMLFMTAGNIIAIYKTKTTKEVRGILSIAPITGVLWIAGFLAISGIPPFGIFVSEFTIAKAMIDQGRIGIAVAFLVILAVVFVGMSAAFLNMAQGPKNNDLQVKDRPAMAFTILPPIALGVMALILGLYIPPVVDNLLHSVASAIGGY
ncbi:MAG TPA: proton-conducting transporter membrane subunit, partial [Sedimentisphaerales bacterium]